MSYSHVVIGTDGSATADRAVATASRIAASLEVPAVIVTAWQRNPSDAPPPSQEASYPGGNANAMDAQWAIAVTSEAAGVTRDRGVTEVRQIQAVGGPTESLLESVSTYPDALLVVGTAGLTDRAERLVGNVPHQLTHHCPVDLLLCTGGSGPWRTAALATDGSRTAARAVERGAALARSVGATPRLVTVARDQTRGERLLAEAVARDVHLAELDQHVRIDRDAVTGLRAVADEHDLLVIGNKGMSGPSRLLGSVSNRLTHDVTTDLLLVNTTR